MTKQANDFFEEPDFVKDEKFLEDEKKKRGSEDGRSWYRPKDKATFSRVEKFNRIRIFPGVKGSDWFLAGGKHWMNFSDSEKGEPVTCMRHSYEAEYKAGKVRCLACDKLEELKAAGAEKDTLEIWRPRRVGMLQVIDRLNLDEGPQLYECPRMTVLNVIVSLGIWLFDKPSKGEVGTDIMLYFDKTAGPRAYTVSVLPNGNMALGTDVELENWLPKLEPLDKEIFYPRISEEEQYVLFFEGKDARDAVREDIRARIYPEGAEEKETAAPTAQPTATAVPKEKPKVEPKKAAVPKVEPKTEGVKVEPKAEVTKETKPKAAFNLDDIKAKVAALKEKKGLK